MIGEMAAVVKQCIKSPSRLSIWSETLGKYVCTDDPEFSVALTDLANGKSTNHPPINSTFKLVFLTAAAGTVLFTAICVTVHLVQGDQMPDTMEKMLSSMLDMAKIGFGAIVGLLGGQAMRGLGENPK
ncbi:hypothetical protein [Phyllobacterium chamaecytisi]|uniref:hypothetical protein n=1 Tax=Phyllobacterium chamaecytisi TaxID=2876082 RepID=UPI001CCB396B|nr:hypothetical protein [Phyllobacterium sp. KW56]MBZ9600487.1 hypothetical protein [Phyllobacterium sp. KW56]